MKKLAAVVTGLLTLAIAATVALFTLGGLTLVSTSGISMQPGFYTGDLAILRPAAEYAVGDVVSYRSDELKTVVMHRIVAIDNGHYTFQGDNNSWLDPEQPTRDMLIGKLALRVPQGGVWLERATSPTAVAAVAFLLLVSGGTTAVLTRRQQRKKRNMEKPVSLPAPLRQLPQTLRTAAAVVATFAVASAAVGLVSWTRPLMSESAEPAMTESSSTMTFSYRATVPNSPAYDGTTVTEPRPVFRRLADEVDVEFAYESDSAVRKGTVRVTAELSTANGWHSSVPLGSPATFTGSTYTGRARLVLSDFQDRADAAAKAIGEDPAGDLSIILVPGISTGEEAAFRPELPFTLNATSLRLAAAEPELTVSHSGPGQSTAAGRQPAKLTLLGQSVLVGQARTAAAGGLALAVVAALVLAVLVRRARHVPEVNAIQVRYAQTLLPVDPMVLPPGRPVVEVPQIDALVRLAERYGLFVMHWERGGTHTYVVLDDGTTYRYRAGAAMPVTELATESADIPDHAAAAVATASPPGQDC